MALAYAVPAPAPASALRERLLERARTERPAATIVPLFRRVALPAAAGLAAAAACAAIALGIWAATLKDSLREARSARGDMTQLLAGVARGDLARLPLRGAHGSAFVNRAGGAVLVVSDVSRSPSGRIYEIWVIDRMKAVPAGLFAGGRTMIVPLLQPVRRGDRIGVTLERAGGVDTPTEPLLFETEKSA